MIDQVEELYNSNPQPRGFTEDLEAHLQTGIVLSLPDCFVMARPVDLGAPIELIGDPFYGFSTEESNAWYVWAFVGKVNSCLQVMPFHLKYVAFARNNGPLRYYDSEKLLRRIRQQG